MVGLCEEVEWVCCGVVEQSGGCSMCKGAICGWRWGGERGGVRGKEKGVGGGPQAAEMFDGERVEGDVVGMEE